MVLEAVDPVRTPSAYQRQLLAALGEADPVEVQSRTPAELRRIVTEAGDRLRTRPAAGEWSVLELVGHLHDAELICSGRYRWILAHDEPALMGYDQDRFVARLDHNRADPDELLSVFEALRRSNLRLWRSTPESDRGRIGMHAERGPESYELTFRLLAGHDLLHLDQMGRTLAAMRGDSSEGEGQQLGE